MGVGRHCEIVLLITPLSIQVIAAEETRRLIWSLQYFAECCTGVGDGFRKKKGADSIPDVQFHHRQCVSLIQCSIKASNPCFCFPPTDATQQIGQLANKQPEKWSC